MLLKILSLCSQNVFQFFFPLPTLGCLGWCHCVCQSALVPKMPECITQTGVSEYSILLCSNTCSKTVVRLQQQHEKWNFLREIELSGFCPTSKKKIKNKISPTCDAFLILNKCYKHLLNINTVAHNFWDTTQTVAVDRFFIFEGYR